MNDNSDFNLEKSIEQWIEQLKADPSVTDTDSMELSEHFRGTIEDLIEKGLDEEEAFLITSMRMGTSKDWVKDYKQVNNPVIQMRRSLIILAGVLVFFLAFYFIQSTSKLLLIILLQQGLEVFSAADWVQRYLISWHFIFVLLLTGIFLFEKIVISYIERIRLKPKHAVYLLLTTVILSLADTNLYPVAKGIMGNNYQLRDQIHHIYMYFDFSFPILLCIGFVVIYFKYYKNTKYYYS